LEVQKIVLPMLLSVVLGPLSIADILRVKPTVHRHLANAPRKRKPHVKYPVRDLFSAYGTDHPVTEISAPELLLTVAVKDGRH